MVKMKSAPELIIGLELVFEMELFEKKNLDHFSPSVFDQKW